jgi:hypothetical protein
MTEKPVRRFELCTERLKTVKDIKKVLKALQIRMDTDNPLYEELEEYFVVEVVPRGYVKLMDTIGHEEIAKMTYEEMEQRIFVLFNENEETN